MEKEKRIEAIQTYPDDCLFLVKRGPLYWERNNIGYTSDITQARVWHRSEILEKLESNGLINKAIAVYKMIQCD